jgi:hypothetical protein
VEVAAPQEAVAVPLLAPQAAQELAPEHRRLRQLKTLALALPPVLHSQLEQTRITITQTPTMLPVHHLPKPIAIPVSAQRQMANRSEVRVLA